MAEKTIMIYNMRTGAGMRIPEKHVANYVGKGYTKTAPKTEKKES